jgi:hypothetical protein
MPSQKQCDQSHVAIFEPAAILIPIYKSIFSRALYTPSAHSAGSSIWVALTLVVVYSNRFALTWVALSIGVSPSRTPNRFVLRFKPKLKFHS